MNKPRHIDIGVAGENFVADYLSACGWEIVERRWRDPDHGRGATDIDLIVRSTDCRYRFVEVKTRTGNWSDTVDFSPERAVTPAKVRRMVEAAERYLVRYGIEAEIQIDVAAVRFPEQPVDGLASPEIRYYPDAVR